MNKVLIAAALSAALTAPAIAQDDVGETIARDGFRVEARASYETPTVSGLEDDDSVYKLGSAFALGGEAGFDIAVSRKVVVGPYGTYEISTVESCDGTDCVRAKDNLAAGLHVGVALNDNGQIYGKLGYASLTLEADVLGVTAQDTGDGFQFAAGYEHGLGETAYARVEFGYADNGQIFGIDFQRRHAGVALGVRF